jgi:hypothetical protein
MGKDFIGCLYLVLVLYLLKVKDGEKNNDFSLISVLSLLILILTPLGSNNGLKFAYYAMWLAIPIAYHYLMNPATINLFGGDFLGSHKFRSKLNLGQNEMIILRRSIIWSFIIFSLGTAYTETYRDSKDRLAMVYQVKHPLLRWVFTTRDRAEVVQELLDNLSKYVKKDDYLIADEDTAMVHFLTKTRPYLYNSWTMTYSPQLFKQSIERAINERPGLPVIVRAKASVSNKQWPNVRGLRVRDSRHREGRAIMNEFIKKYNYSIVWENRFFQILLPPKYKIETKKS